MTHIGLFASVDFTAAWHGRSLLLTGALITFELTVISMSIGLVIGLLVALARLSKIRALQLPARVYTSSIRGTPLLVQLFILYFALPDLGIMLSPYAAGILGLSINIGAYLAEVYRAGIQSVPAGQYEASLSIGMTYWQTMRLTVVPQAVRNVLPALGNDFIGLMKDTSLVSIVTITELMRQGQIIARSSFSYLGTFIVVAFMYWCMTFVSSIVLNWSERRMARSM